VAAGTFHVSQKHRAQDPVHLFVLHGFLGGVDGSLDLVCIAVTVLAIHHDRERFDFRSAVRHFTVARKALHFFVLGMYFVKLHAVRLMLFAEAMAVQTCGLGYFAGPYDLFLVTGLFAIYIIGNKFGVIDGHQSALDDLVRHLVAIPTIRLNHSLVRLVFSEKMTRITSVIVYAEVLVAFEMAMTRATPDGDSISRFFNVIGVCELDAIVVERFRRHFFDTMTVRPQTGRIFDERVRLRAHPAYHAIHGLSQTVDLAFDIPGKAGL
jgi:hypothetical protein